MWQRDAHKKSGPTGFMTGGLVDAQVHWQETLQSHHRASCHCRAVVLEILLPEGLPDPHRCYCSLCKRKGAIVAAVPTALPFDSNVKAVNGSDVVSVYDLLFIGGKCLYAPWLQSS